MDLTEVTVGQFKKFLKSSAYKPEKPIDWAKLHTPTDDHPMIYATWFDATAYCEWGGKRLPTEKEWELEARGGLVDKEFAWGNEESIAREYANFGGTLGRGQWDKTTAPAGSFRPNGYGLFGMAGSVWEWYQGQYNSGHDTHVLRGGLRLSMQITCVQLTTVTMFLRMPTSTTLVFVVCQGRKNNQFPYIIRPLSLYHCYYYRIEGVYSSANTALSLASKYWGISFFLADVIVPQWYLLLIKGSLQFFDWVTILYLS